MEIKLESLDGKYLPILNPVNDDFFILLSSLTTFYLLIIIVF